MRDRTAVICMCLTVLVLLFVLGALNIHASEMSALPVGLVADGQADLNSSVAGTISDRIRSNEALHVYSGSLDELKDMLADGYIYCIIELGPGLEETVRRGEYKGIMTMYSAKDSPVAALIGDIAAGCAMDAVCMYKAYNTYSVLESAGEKEHADLAGYSARLETMKRDGGYDFVFDTEYIDTGKKVENEITNALIYRQVIAGLIAMLLALTAFSACNPITREYAAGIRGRLSISAKGSVLLCIGEAAGLFTCCMPAAILAGLLSGRSIKAVLSMILLNTVLLAVAVAGSYLLALVLKNVMAYQVAGTILIITLSTAGFISIFEGLTGGNLFIHTPVAAFIRCYTEFL